jgi:hypothetical protein
MASAVLKSTDVALPQLPAGWQLDTVAVLADSSLALLATNVDLAHEWRRDEKGFCSASRAAGHRPPARPRGQWHRAGRIGVLAVGAAPGIGGFSPQTH